MKLTCISFCSHPSLLPLSPASTSSQVFPQKQSTDRQEKQKIRHSSLQRGCRMAARAAAASLQAESKDLLIIGETRSPHSCSTEGAIYQIIRTQTGHCLGSC